MEQEKVRDEPRTAEVYQNQIDLYLKLFCEEHEIESMKKETQSVWNACLMYIRRHVFYDDVPVKVRCGNRYDDIDSLMAVCEHYIYLCYLYDKEIGIKGFCKLTGISQDTIHSWGNKEYRGSSTMLYSELYKTLHDEKEESLTAKLSTANKNPVGILAILNHWYSWNMQPVVQEKKQILSVDEPKLIAEKYGMDEEEAKTLKLPEPPED